MSIGKTIAIDREGIRQAALAAGKDTAFDEAEAQFIERLRDQESEALDILINRYSADLYALLFRLVGNQYEAEDLLQETLISAVRGIKSFRGESSLKTWLTRIAINHSRSRLRKIKRQILSTALSLTAFPENDGQSIADRIEAAGENAEDALLRQERETAVLKALEKLPDIYREAVVLCDIEGLSYEEIAITLEINLGTVKSRISRGREELRRQLKDF
ncbi:MAG TPA: sigma-70 family RNA polymerase sigma factor [Pyrinomonadaceae bacterium]|nr:sigma-70 family RNA polymerase sigma factor [Pyrinomonadaceae bacterium]